MDLAALFEELEKLPPIQWTATIEEASIHSDNSGFDYAYCESVLYFGDPQIRSESWSPWRQGDEIKLLVNGRVFEIECTRIRTFLDPSYSKTYTAAQAKKEGLFEDLLAQDRKIFLSEEYGLVKGKTYYIKPAVESYHLPPAGPGGRLRQRSNQVLWISDTPYKDGKSQSGVTPGYLHWSY